MVTLCFKNIIFFLFITSISSFCYGLLTVQGEEHEKDKCPHEVTKLMSAGPNIQTAVDGASFAENVEQVNEWSPLQMTNGEDYTFGNYGLVILNMPIQIDCSQMVALWNNAALRVTADGGTNRWYEYCKTISSDVHLTRKDPDLVTGDFDSIGESFLQSCRNNSNIKVVCTPDQSKTDFTKALKEMEKFENSEKVSGNSEEYDFFTLDNVLIHIIVFFACFLFY